MKLARAISGAALIATLAVPLWASSAAAQAPQTSENDGVGSQPASVAELADAVGDCEKYVRHHGQVDAAGLKAAGWGFAGKQESKAAAGMPANTAFYFGKGNVVMLVRHTGIAATCQTLGKVDDPARLEEVRRTIVSTTGAKPAKEYSGDDQFKAMLVSRTGPAALDSLLISDVARISVMSSSKDGTAIVTAIVVPRILD